MEFSDIKSKCKKIQKTDMNGNPLPEAFYALITDESTESGTPLNAEVMNKGNWRDDNSVSFAVNHGETLEQQSYLTQIYTSADGETWLVPPAGQKEQYQLSAGHKALNTLRDPTTGQKNHLQDIINNSVNLFTKPCTALEYDNLNLTAIDYDNKRVNALDCDVYGALVLKDQVGDFSGYDTSIFDLRDPTTGQKNFLQNILNNLFNLMAQSLTREEYDNLNLSAEAYDNKNITAINYDMCGRSLLI